MELMIVKETHNAQTPKQPQAIVRLFNIATEPSEISPTRPVLRFSWFDSWYALISCLSTNMTTRATSHIAVEVARSRLYHMGGLGLVML
jgi:hypothetical protein